ncbi:MAG: peroxiredoxin [Pseudomonadota bacterium]
MSAHRFAAIFALASALLCTALPMPAQAALDVGDSAPDFSTAAALAGKQFQFSLSGALAKGPVVLYFFPAAFSEGCSIEAHNFAEAIGQFEAFGATVIGVSRDDIGVLSRFSVQACNGRFAVASDESLAIARSFDAVMQHRPDYANRVSYVIAPSGKVAYSYLSLNPARHVQNTLAALKTLAQRNPK